MKRPYVICHMCSTIDGRIIGSRWGKIPGQKSGANLFETTAATFGIHAWLVGTTTMKEFAGHPQKLKAAPRGFKRGDHVANPKAKRFAIGTDTRGVLRFQKDEVDGDHTVILTTEWASNAYLAHLQAAGVSYLICGSKRIDLALALAKLRKTFTLTHLMLEGGGAMNGSMLHAGLVDEISHVVLPIVDGGVGVQCLFDIPGPPPKKAAATLKVISEKKLAGGVRWLKYRVSS